MLERQILIANRKEMKAIIRSLDNFGFKTEAGKPWFQCRVDGGRNIIMNYLVEDEEKDEAVKSFYRSELAN